MEQRRSYLKKSGLVVLGLAVFTVISPVGPALAKTQKFAMIVDLDHRWQTSPSFFPEIRFG